jgi:hypothetical protein
MGRPLWFRLRGRRGGLLACFSCSIAGRKEGMLGTDGGVFSLFLCLGFPFPFWWLGGGNGLGSPLSPPRSEPIFFPFWCLINNKREERDLHCAVVQLSIRFVLFSPLETFRGRGVWRTFCSRLLGFMGAPRPFEPLSWAFCPFDSFSFLVFGGGGWDMWDLLSWKSLCFPFETFLEDVLFETLGFMGAPRPFEPLSWALCPFWGVFEGEKQKRYHFGTLGKKNKNKKTKTFF